MSINRYLSSLSISKWVRAKGQVQCSPVGRDHFHPNFYKSRNYLKN
jgi:hypothetical protein